MGLWDYQRATIDNVEAAIASGKKKPLIVCPTGGGKTKMGVAWCKLHSRETTVWLAHRRELIKQAVATLQSEGIRAGAFGLDRSAKVQVASIQQLLVNRQAPDGMRVVVDEARHLLAPQWSQLAEIYKDAIIVGLDATPERPDGLPMDDVFDEMIVSCQHSTLLRLNEQDDTKGLVKCNVIPPKRSEVTPTGILGPGEIAMSPCEAYLEHARDRLAIVFASTIAAATAFVEDFKKNGVKAHIITEKTSKNERDSSIERFKNGDVRVLVNVRILTEGFDAPECNCVILASPCVHPSDYLQKTGRGLRAAKGKTRSLCIDLYGSFWLHGFPTEDREYSLHGVPILRRDKKDPLCPQCQMLLDEDGNCPRCPPREYLRSPAVPPTPVDAPMEEIEWHEGLRTQTISKRLSDLVECIVNAKGGDIRNGFWRFKKIYRYFPNRNEVEKAKAIIAGMETQKAGGQ